MGIYRNLCIWFFFVFISGYYSIIYLYLSLLVDEHLGRFQVLIVIKKAANILAQFFFLDIFSCILSKFPGVELLDRICLTL